MKRSTMRGKVTKEELRKDPILEFITKVMNYVVRNREKVLWGVVIIIAAFVAGYFFFSSGSGAPPQVKLSYIQAVSLYMSGDTTNSVEIFRNLAQTASSKIEGKRSLYYLGDFYLRQGNIEEAERYYQRFLKSKPHDPLLESGAYAALGSIALSKGDPQKALQDYLRAEELAPFESQKALYLYKAALAAEAAGDYKKALDFLEEFEQKYKDHPLYGDVRGEMKFIKGAVSAR
ncbi:MAG TPA: tetratricopeptide repeat protein [candidate division WOR-3 bacterium]|uniref:Tetratricopeptide repeat protein n=1 Tax=candidate division WOR-3 bacterium TaxID=2052148 RepID=A0A7C1BF06_UNCW3|nr:MAG: hypothetical protein DRQ04_00430 [Candidatus Hydrothermae bacterium]HDM89820.1 tetratricopeptide repeat protein [candidate division WOR-3 bacterium]